jgi:fructose-1,6-bisphosphatase/inositol monophosphatase family enzyme
LLVEEAGGRVGTLSGGEYTQGGNIIAASPRVYEGLVSLVAPHLTDSLREG